MAVIAWILAFLAGWAAAGEPGSADAGETWVLWRNGSLGVEFERPASWDEPVMHCGNTFMGRKHPLAGDYAPDDWDFQLVDFAHTDPETGAWTVATVYFHPNADGPAGKRMSNCEPARDVPEGALPEGVTEWAHKHHPMRAWVVMAGRRRLTLRVGEHREDDRRVLRAVASRMRLLRPEEQQDLDRDGWRTWRTEEFEVAYPRRWTRVAPTRDEGEQARRLYSVWTCEDEDLGSVRFSAFAGLDPVVMELGEAARGAERGTNALDDPAAAWIAERVRDGAAFGHDDRRWTVETFMNDSGQEGVREQMGGDRAAFVWFTFFGSERVYRLQFGPIDSTRGKVPDRAFARAGEIARRFRIIEDDAPARR